MAARGVNKVILVGNLGQDPEIRYMPQGGAVANITLATSDSWRDKQTGEMRESVEWHRVVLFGKLAEIAGEYLRKGAQVYIEGELRTRKWTDQTGQDRYTTEVTVNARGTMQMLGRAQVSTSPDGRQTTGQAPARTAPIARAVAGLPPPPRRRSQYPHRASTRRWILTTISRSRIYPFYRALLRQG